MVQIFSSPNDPDAIARETFNEAIRDIATSGGVGFAMMASKERADLICARFAAALRACGDAKLEEVRVISGDRAAVIAREIAMRHGPAMSGGGKELAKAIAAALRAYGDAKLEEAASEGARFVRSLKSKPESKEPTA